MLKSIVILPALLPMTWGRVRACSPKISVFIVKRLVISRLPSSLLEMRILFEHRIPRFQERSAEPQILGFARDDKERETVHERVSPEPRRIQFGQL